MRHLPLFMCTAFCGLYSLQTEAADKKNERPNILWLTFEDTSAYEFGCYGNGDVHTPNADSLAARGIQFMNLLQITKAVGTNVTIKLLTIVPNVERISLSSLYITQ